MKKALINIGLVVSLLAITLLCCGYKGQVTDCNTNLDFTLSPDESATDAYRVLAETEVPGDTSVAPCFNIMVPANTAVDVHFSFTGDRAIDPMRDSSATPANLDPSQNECTFQNSKYLTGNDTASSSNLIYDEAIPERCIGYTISDGATLSIPALSQNLDSLSMELVFPETGQDISFNQGEPLMFYVAVQLGYTVTVSDDGHGSASATPTQWLTAGDEVALSAEAAEGFEFDYWETLAGAEPADASSASTTVTMTASDAEYVAHFKALPEYPVTVSTDGHGSASADVATAYAGKKVTLSAKAAEGYEFDCWETLMGAEPADANSASTTMIMSEGDVAYKAHFKAVEKPTPAPDPDEPSPDPTPATGDSNGLFVLLGILTAACGCCLALALAMRRRNQA